MFEWTKSIIGYLSFCCATTGRFKDLCVLALLRSYPVPCPPNPLPYLPALLSLPLFLPPPNRLRFFCSYFENGRCSISYRVFINYCAFPQNVFFLNSASSAAALVFDLPLCAHTDTEGKPRETIF